MQSLVMKNTIDRIRLDTKHTVWFVKEYLILKQAKRRKYKVSTIKIVDKKTTKSKLHTTLEQFCQGKTDPLPVEVASKLSYATCLRAYEAKYHADCMQRFLSGVSISDCEVNLRNFNESKNKIFDKFCDWYETAGHDTGHFTLYDVQKRMEERSDHGDDIYTIKQINRKLLHRYGHNLTFTNCPGGPTIMMFKEVADNLLVDSLYNPELEEELFKEVISMGKIIKDSLHEEPDQRQDEFYPYANDLTLGKIATDVPSELRCLLDSIFSPSRSETSQNKKELRKISIAHAIMQWSKKEDYLSPLLLTVGFFIHRATRSRVVVDVLYSLGYSVSYTEIMDSEMSAAVSTAVY